MFHLGINYFHVIHEVNFFHFPLYEIATSADKQL